MVLLLNDTILIKFWDNFCTIIIHNFVVKNIFNDNYRILDMTTTLYFDSEFKNIKMLLTDVFSSYSPIIDQH